MKTTEKNKLKSHISKIALNVSLLIEIKEATETPTKDQLLRIDNLYRDTVNLMYETAAQFLEFKVNITRAAGLRNKKRLTQQQAVKITNSTLFHLRDFLNLKIPDKFLKMENTVIGQPLTRKKTSYKIKEIIT